jgi:sugar phosphate isomerase/epimerase
MGESERDVELVGAYWTVAGPVEVHLGREWSLFDFRDRCAQAARVGFRGTGLWHADLEHQLESRSLDEIKSIFDDAGLRYLELEFLWEWFLDPDDERRREAEPTRKLLFEAAGTLGAHHIKVGNIPGTPCELDQVTEKYAELCADASNHTDAKIAYEFMPFDVNVNSLDSVLAVVEGAGAANGGIVIDTWHMAKLGIAPDDLRRIPLEYLTWVELSDGQFENMDDRIMETTQYRRLPGEGEFDIPGYVAVAQDMGYSEGWGVEVLSNELRSHPIEEIFDKAFTTARSQFSGASAPA